MRQQRDPSLRQRKGFLPNSWLAIFVVLAFTLFASNAEITPGRIAYWERYTKLRENVKTRRDKLTKFRVVIQPIWWPYEDTTDPNLALNLNSNENQKSLTRVVEYFKRMSWNQCIIEFIYLPQAQLTGCSDNCDNFDSSAKATSALVESQGLTVGNDYDSLIIHYNLASG